MSMRFILVLGISAACAAAHAEPLQTTTPAQGDLSPDRLQRIDRWLDSEIAQKHKAGAMVLIARHGKLAYTTVRGQADIASATPLKPDAMFRLFSMTKPITSVALLTLYERGKFQLTDRLDKYISAFKNVKVFAGLDAKGNMLLEAPKRAITIQDVFRHTAGFVYGYFGDTPVDKAYRAAGIDYAKLDSLKELVDKIASMPLLYQPGERWVYSFAHDIQAYLVEYFSGMRFDAYCRQAIFEPLGMKETVFGVPPKLASRFPTVYAADKGGGLVSRADDDYARQTEHPFGGSSLSSTAADYLLFAQMLLNGGELRGVRILGRKTVELMTSDNLPAGTPSWGEGWRYGLGVSVITDPAKVGNLGTAGEFGWGGHATTSFLVDPKQDLIAMMFTQYMPIDNEFVSEFKTLVYQAVK